MSEQDKHKPLTRRERRLLEMAQQAEAETSSQSSEAKASVNEQPSAQTPAADAASEVEITPFDAEGQPRTRREIRLLRQAALAAQEEQTHVPSEVSVDEEISHRYDEVSKDESVEDHTRDHGVTEAAVEEAESVDQVGEEPDDLRMASTQPLSLEELFELNNDDEQSDLVGEDLLVDETVQEDDQQIDELHAEVIDIKVSKDTESVDVKTEILDHVSDDAEDRHNESFLEEPETVTGVVETEDEEPETDDDGYTFPDIQPLEEERSVFDDPSVRTVSAPSLDDGEAESDSSGFEDMIERAIADEGASGHTSTASLILPALPDSDGISGPIGDTGELFITGSIELPKSLGETGGHSKIHETIDSDPFALLEIGDDYETGEHDSSPVSASRAVSSRSGESTGLVSPEVQKDTKLPLILAVSGGGLILLLVGAGIWAFSSGLFG